MELKLMSDKPKRRKTPAWQQAQYNYEKRRVIKRVSFNIEKEADLLAKAERMDDFSGWVKARLQEV
jgi:hypothetical protein